MNFRILSLKYTLANLLLLISLDMSAQSPGGENINALLKRLPNLKQDTNRVIALSKLARHYMDTDRDKTLQYASDEQRLANQLNYTKGQIQAYEDVGFAISNFGKFQQQLDYFRQGYNLADAHKFNNLKYQLLKDIGYANENIKNYAAATSSFAAVAQYYLQTKNLEKKGDSDSDETWKHSAWYQPAHRAIFDYSFYLKNDQAALTLCRQILNKQLHDNDTIGIRAALRLVVDFYRRNDANQALRFAREQLRYFKPGDTTSQHSAALSLNAALYTMLKNYTKAMEYYRAAIALNPNANAEVKDMANGGMSYIYRDLEDYDKAFKLDLERYKALVKPAVLNDKTLYIYGPFIGDCIALKKYDQALFYLNELLLVLDKANAFDIKATYLGSLTEIYYHMHKYDEAMHAVKESLSLNPEAGGKHLDFAWLGILIRDAPAGVLKKYGISPASRYPLAVKNLRLALDFYEQRGWEKTAMMTYKELSTTYELTKDYKNYHDTYKKYIAIRDSSINRVNQNAFISKLADIEHQKKEDLLKYQQRLTNEKAAQQKKYYVSGIIVLLAVSLLVAWNYRGQRKANRLLSKQQEEIARQRDQLIDTISNLEKTQKQLIQAEKMASLGELTAGIAHEIQNPLNFVNNFSEVSAEMMGELKVELDKGDIEEAKAVATDVEQNLKKIQHHGKRADGIVKGMLEHSRTSTGQKESTDLNKLADEYLRLAYHGLRAKDKTFNAELITHFQENLPLINIIPQDIGRVMLNLFNNAFYAVQQKQKTAGTDYKPTVEITIFTPPSGGWEAAVKDNGNGIPDNIKDKIMQPFFTTKPTGEGTGLGLSLSYDIVVKGHGGSIQIESNEGEGAEFTIQLPIVS